LHVRVIAILSLLLDQANNTTQTSPHYRWQTGRYP
jgi:hypothetical protein